MRSRLLLAAVALPAVAIAAGIESTREPPAYVWDDQQVAATTGVGASALTAVTIPGASGKVLTMSSTGTDALTLYAQMSHGWARTLVRPHCHIMPLYNPVAQSVVRFSGQWAWTDVNGVLPAGGSWTSFGPVDVTIETTDALKHKLVSIGTVAPSAAPGSSSVLVVHVMRDGASASDTYTVSGPSNLAVLGCDVHYQANAFGTTAEY